MRGMIKRERKGKREIEFRVVAYISYRGTKGNKINIQQARGEQLARIVRRAAASTKVK